MQLALTMPILRVPLNSWSRKLLSWQPLLSANHQTVVVVAIVVVAVVVAVVGAPLLLLSSF